MIRQQGRVVRVELAHAWVQVGGTSGCPACDAGQGCGAGIFGKLLRRDPIEIRVHNSGAVQAGSAVTLGLEESRFLRLVWRLYGLPLLAALMAAIFVFQGALYLGWGTLLLDLASLGAALLVGGAALYIGSKSLRKSVEGLEMQLLEQHPLDNCPGFEPSRPPGVT